MKTSAEQQARDLLERMEIDGAQAYSAGELVELANVIADANAYRRTKAGSDGLKHCVVVKDIASGYVTVNWKYDDIDWARWKAAELGHYDQRNREFSIAIVSL